MATWTGAGQQAMAIRPDFAVQDSAFTGGAMKPATVFWDVDTQADFMSPEGTLSMSGAQAIVPNLERLTSWAKAHGIVIVASTDAHSTDDPEFKLYPPHCVIGTAGQKKLRETLLADHVVIPSRPVRTDYRREAKSRRVHQSQR
jgi:hypothetical protein